MVIAPSLFALLAAQGAATAGLPPSLKPGALEACHPTTLDSAERCLRNSLSSDDLKIVADRIPARRFRPDLDCALEGAWKLTDPTSPMAKFMDKLLGLHHPALAAGMILSDLPDRLGGGGGMPFDDMREQLKKNPPQQDDPTICASISTPSI